MTGCYSDVTYKLLLAVTKDGGRKHEENVSDDFSVENSSGPRDGDVWVERLKEEYLSLIQVRFALKQRHKWG